MSERAVRYIVALSLGFSLLGGVSARAEQVLFGQRSNFLINGGLRRGNVFARGNFNVNFGNIKPINGFAKLATAGNAIVEQTTDQFGRLFARRLFIDRFGRLFGASSQETVRELQEFYLQNFDNFGRGAQQVIARFLLRNPQTANALLGNVSIDFSKAIPPGDSSYVRAKRMQTLVAGLNFCLNSLSTRRGLMRVSPAQVGEDGVLRINLRSILRPQAIALLFNPRESSYDCEGRGTFDVGQLLERCTDPTIYYQALRLSDKLDDFGKQVGVFTDARQTVRNKFLVAGTESDRVSGVGINPQRLIERQPELNNPGGCYFRSYDFLGENSSGSKRRSKDVFRCGVNCTNDASEILFTLPNGMMGAALFDAKGNRLDDADGQIANGGITNAPGSSVRTVVNFISCVKCHKDGFIAGQKSKLVGDKDKVYQDHLLNGNIRIDRGFFSTATEEQRDRDNCSNIFRNSVIRSGSCVPDVDNRGECMPPLPDIVQQYREPLTENDAKQYLGLCGNTVKTGMLDQTQIQQRCASVQLPAQVKQFFTPSGNNKGELRIDRGRFEDNYCAMKRALGGSGALAAGGGLRPPAANRLPAQGAFGFTHQDGQ